MTEPPDKRASFEELRSRAERILESGDHEPAGVDGTNLIDLIQELEIQQVELQLQNEELREAAKRVEASERKYAELYQFAPVGYVTLDGQGTVAQANQAACQMLGLPFKRLKGRGFSLFVAREHHQVFFRSIREIAGTKKKENFCEIELVRSDNSTTYVQLAVAAPHHEGRFRGWQLAFTDISERKRFEKELMESEEKYRSIFEVAKDAIIVADTESGQILEVNAYACDLYGYAADEVLKLKKADLSAEPDESDRVRSSPVNYVPLRYDKKKDGTVFPVEMSVSRHFQTGRLVSTYVVRDITERKEKERRLEESERELRYLSSRLLTIQEQERKDLATELHDRVSTSLGAIKYFAENLFDRCVDESSKKGCDEGLHKLTSLIQNTMEESRRLMANLRPSILDDFGIVTTIQSLCKQHAEIYENRHVETDIRVVEQQVPEILKITIYRILQAALSNVATHSGAEFVEVGLRIADGKLELRVEDNGKGFDVSSARENSEAFGIFSMKEMAELSGGSFAVESRAEEGTAITATWPLQDAD